MEVSAPAISIEEEVLNANNPFKKRLNWIRLRCILCNEIVLGKGIGTQKEWDKIRFHLKIRHGIEEDEGIPIRLLSHHLHKKWVRNRIKEISINRS